MTWTKFSLSFSWQARPPKKVEKALLLLVKTGSRNESWSNLPRRVFDVASIVVGYAKVSTRGQSLNSQADAGRDRARSRLPGVRIRRHPKQGHDGRNALTTFSPATF